MHTSTFNGTNLNYCVATYFQQVQTVLNNLDQTRIVEAVQVLLEANRRGASVYIFGNGGSAATASHFANDLAKGCIVESQPRFRAISLTDNVALMTAWANDTGYDNVFAEPLRGLVRPGDVVVGISGSGNSANVLKGITVAREMGAYTLGMCGYGGGKLGKLVDLAISSDCTVMQQVEDAHMFICHNLATTITAALTTCQPAC